MDTPEQPIRPGTNHPIPNRVLFLEQEVVALRGQSGGTGGAQKPTVGSAPGDPVDGATRPNTVAPGADNDAPFLFLNSSDGSTWVYDPGADVWRGEKTTTTAIPQNASEVTIPPPVGFNKTHLADFWVERLSGDEELSANTVERTGLSLVIDLQGSPSENGTHQIIARFKK